MDEAVETYLAETVEKFRLLRKSERGEVWLAGMASGAVVVLKRVWDDGLPYAVMASHPHPLWPNILYTAEMPGETVVVEEFVQGEPLSARLEQKRFLPEPEAANLFLQIAEGLIVLHGLGVVHRDIKPSNLILTESGAIRLIDFDAARTVKEEQAEDTSLLGTKGYAPPEQFGYGQTDARSDLYALGVTMRKMLAPDYYGWLSPILAKCTELDPKRRYASARELKRAILMRRRWAKAKTGCFAALAILVGAALYFLPAPTKNPKPTPEEPTAIPTENVTPTPKEEPAAPAAVPEPPKQEENDEEETTPQETEAPAAPQETETRQVQNEPPATLTPDEEAEAFLALFADDPEKLHEWKARKEADFRFIEKQNLSHEEADAAKRDALDAMRRIELGRRAEAFQKTLPKTMTRDEKGRAFNEFVFEQIEILGITDW